MVLKIVIAGGGIAGLAVAHGLQRARRKSGLDIEVIVYEKRTEETSFQQYPIHIAPDGRSALKALLASTTHAKLLERYYHGITHGGINIGSSSGRTLFALRRYEGEQPQFVHRYELKRLLEEEEAVRLIRGIGVEVVGRRTDGKPGVGVALSDGSTVDADLVIGADGIGSTLRAKLYPHLARFPMLPYFVIQLKLSTSTATLQLNEPDGINCVLGSNGHATIMVAIKPPSTTSPPQSGSSDPFADPCPGRKPDPRPPAVDEDTTESSEEEYIYVAITLSTTALVPAFSSRAETDLKGVEEDEWLEALVDLFTADGAPAALIDALRDDVVPGSVGAWRIISADQTVPWGHQAPTEQGDDAGAEDDGWKKRVVLIGDAAHAMPPQGGVGGSTALKDAELLVEAIVSSSDADVTEGGPALDELLESFHSQMTIRADGHIADANRRLRLSVRSGWRVYTRNALLWCMGWFTGLADWILNRGRDQARYRLAATSTLKDKKA